MRVGNAAADQLQLDTYGELLQTAWLYTTAGHRLDHDIARRLAETADFICTIWQQPDAGIWEVRSAPEHFTQSNMMCWITLDRALDLAERHLIPDRHATRWRRERQAIAQFVDDRCFSPRLNSYGRSAGTDDLDAGLLLGLLHGYRPPDDPRMGGTVAAIQRTLQDFINGQIFALLYYAIFAAIGYSSWWLGTVFGLVHGLFAATALVNILLPLVHPRMGTPHTSAPHVALLEPPGFLMLNYGPGTPTVTLTAHLAYGTIVGGFLAWPG